MIELTGDEVFIGPLDGDPGGAWHPIGTIGNVALTEVEPVSSEPITWAGTSTVVTGHISARQFRVLTGWHAPWLRKMHGEYHRRRRYW